MVGYVYHRSSMRFSEVPVPEKIGPPVPIVEVDLGYRVAIVEEAVFR